MVGSTPFLCPWTEGDHGLLLYNNRIYVPEALRAEVIERNHDDPLAGHFGVQKTLELISRRYHWPLPREVRIIFQAANSEEGNKDPTDETQWPKGMRARVEEYCERCAVCRRSKAARHKPYGTLSPLPVPEYKWSEFTMDFVVSLPPSKDWNGAVYNTILVIVDRLTKMVHYISVINTITTPQLYEVLDRKVFSLHGLPDSIVSDRDSLITSGYWKALMRYMTVDRQMSTPFRPQTDGQTERQNLTMEQYLRAYVNFEQDDWVKWLPKAEFAYNNAYNSSIKMTPFFANLGYNPRMSYEHEIDQRSANETAHETITKHRKILTMLKAELAAAQERQATAYNRHATEQSYDIGEWVYLNRKNIKTTRPCRKLDWKFIGPFQVLEKYGKNAYRLDLPANFEFHDVFHVSLLEKNPSEGQVEDTTRDIDASVEGDVDPDEYDVVEDIVGSRIFAKSDFYENSPAGLHYLVHWINQPESECTWEPVVGVKHLKRLISRFHYRHPDAVSSTKAPAPRIRKRKPRELDPESTQPERIQPTRTGKKDRGACKEENT